MHLLKERAKGIKKDIVRMIAEAGSGHPGGSLSIVEILTVLYFDEMKYNPENPLFPERDRFVLCKGHAAPALYAVLAEAGFFPKEHLMTLRKLGSILQGHPDMNRTPGIEISSGSLGQGLSVANGMALAAKIDKKDYRVYALMGDGELQEGQVWEAAMTASHHKLDNLVAIIDRNMLQIDGCTENIKSLEPLAEKWASFNWNVIEIDGHDFRSIKKAFSDARKIKGKPTVIIAKTIKGMGVSFMENKEDYHGKPITKEQLPTALSDIEVCYL